MIGRLWRRMLFSVERQLVRGAQYRLMVVAGLVGLISIGGGIAVQAWGSGHDDLPAAIWWAFLRLSDPGYLGDDAGVVNRVVSTGLTVLGYVVFLGALVAIMTQWLNARMEKLESGLTPIARNDHILVLGWTNRTPSIVRELLLSKGRVRRFLRRQGVRSLHVVLLVEEVNARLVQDLRDAVGDAWDEKTVTVRSGTPIRVDHLERVDFRNATRIIVPGSEFGRGGADSVDTLTIKTLLSLSSADGNGELPVAVAEVFNVAKIPVARRAYGGDLEVIASDAVISRLLAQNVRHPGLSAVYNELLTHGTGSEIYMRSFEELEGLSFAEAAGRFARAIVLGVVRAEEGRIHPYLNPPPDLVIQAGDSLALLAHEYEDAVPDRRGTAGEAAQRGHPRPRSMGTGGARRVLIMGWNHKLPQLIREFRTYPDERYSIDILSSVPARTRERALGRVGEAGEGVEVRQIEGDYSVEEDLRGVGPEAYDTVLVVGSDWLKSEEESDARTILGYLSLQGILEDGSAHVVVELLDPNNLPLLGRGEGEVLISPLVLSHMLALVALRRELRAVFEELFTAGGAEITFCAGGEYGLSGTVSFGDIRAAADARGETALGVREADGALSLNPPEESRWALQGDTRVVTLVTYANP